MGVYPSKKEQAQPMGAMKKKPAAAGVMFITGPKGDTFNESVVLVENGRDEDGARRHCLARFAGLWLPQAQGIDYMLARNVWDVHERAGFKLHFLRFAADE